ncbi:hypothetical protein MOKP105_04390 [Mycobacterium avium subsp. hominissuis]
MVASTAAGYVWTGSPVAVRPHNARTAAAAAWLAVAVANRERRAAAAAGWRWRVTRPKAENGVFLPPDDNWRVCVQAARGGADGGPGEILTYDLDVTNLVIQRNLSDGCDISFDVDPNDPSSYGLDLKSYGQYVHIEKVMLGKRRIWCTGIVQPSDIDENTGILHVKCKGFAAYPKGIPWLEDITKIDVDAFWPVVEIWRHLQEDFPNGNLDVTVTPQESGVEMLAGYAFDGNLLNLNFFALFVRATDKLDCGDYINALARDVPFDYREISEWNADRTNVKKTFQLGYPRLGVIQENLAFVLNENVLSAKPHTETQTDYITDVGVTGWFPGVQYSSELSNADPDRLRRYLSEDDAMIDSNERAAAWAHRRLARRQTPPYWETITINPDHPNAPRGSYDVGDTIIVSGYMPWVGFISQEHKIISISDDVTKGVTQLALKAEGAFNYDPIVYPDGSTNIVVNSGFDNNLNGWTPTGPGWAWSGTDGNGALGCATITADGTDHDIVTQAYGVEPFQIFPLAVDVKCVGAVCASSSAVAVQLVAQFYDQHTNPTHAYLVASISGPAGAVPWRKIAGNVETPVDSTKVALRLHVDKVMTGGTVKFDNASLML